MKANQGGTGEALAGVEGVGVELPTPSDEAIFRGLTRWDEGRWAKESLVRRGYPASGRSEPSKNPLPPLLQTCSLVATPPSHGGWPSPA